MLALYLNFALLCLVSSVLGRPARLTGTTNTRIEQDESTDDDVWEPLYDGHKTYLSDMERENPGLLEDQATNGQHPNFVVIACSDSRVAPEMIFSTLPGTVFSERVVANLFDADDLHAHTTIYYAVEHLHSRHIVVMGHYGCGGVAAAIASPPPEPMSEADKGIQEWIKPIRDTYSSSDREEIVKFRESHGNKPIEEPELHDPAFRALVEENVKKNVHNVGESEFIMNHWGNATNPPVFVHGMVYNIENGDVFDLNVTMGPAGVLPPQSPFPLLRPA